MPDCPAMSCAGCPGPDGGRARRRVANRRLKSPSSGRCDQRGFGSGQPRPALADARRVTDKVGLVGAITDTRAGVTALTAAPRLPAVEWAGWRTLRVALRIEHSKRRGRMVPLARPVVVALQAWRATSAGARARQRGARPRVFVSMTRAREQDGALLSAGAIAKIVAGYAAQADLPPACVPRTSCATRCTAIAEREGLDDDAELIGHADACTSKRYLSVTAARTQNAIDGAFGVGTFAAG